MKAYEVTGKMIKKWEKDGWIAVACRICNDVMLFPSPTYNKKMLIGYECPECKRRKRNEHTD